MSSIVIIRVDDIPKAPEAFQEYVWDWFAPQKVLGLDCMVASTLLHLESSDWSRRGCRPGVAPGHSVDLMNYKKGLPKGRSLNEWMDKANGKLITVLYATERHDSSFDDD